MDEDIDGIPIATEKISAETEGLLKAGSKSGAFIPSKWETIDPEQVEAQAVTTSKWDTLDAPEPPKFYDSSSGDDDNDGDEHEKALNYDELKRKKLREIELKTMQYQDELESGQRESKSSWTIAEQVESYRNKLMKKVYTSRIRIHAFIVILFLLFSLGHASRSAFTSQLFKTKRCKM